MNIKQIPLSINNISKGIYAGFWSRLGSLILDGLILSPLVLIFGALNAQGRSIYFYTIIPYLLITVWYEIYLVKKNGGTPGKLLSGIKIIKLNGNNVGWKEAILRHSVSLFFMVLKSIVIAYLLLVNEEYFLRYGAKLPDEFLKTVSPNFHFIILSIGCIWIFSELVTLLTNKRKRAIHDYIAGTVVVQSDAVGRIRETMRLKTMS